MNESMRELGYFLRAIGVLPNDMFKEPVVPKSHRIEETLVNVDDVKPQPYPIQHIGLTSDRDITTKLRGSSKDRRKQLRRIKKENPDCIIKVTAPCMFKMINGERVHVEDANVPQTIVVIKPKEK